MQNSHNEYSIFFCGIEHNVLRDFKASQSRVNSFAKTANRRISRQHL